MTAEALYCRLMLEEMNGVNLAEPAATEATTQLLAAPPNAERINLYYWYYATLALHHRQQSNDAAKAAWHTWNDGDDDRPHEIASHRRQRRRQLELEHHLGRLRRPRLHDRDGGDVPGSLLPLRAGAGPQGRWTAARPQSQRRESLTR